MVIVRESPRAHLSPDKNRTQWPPRSPFQALLSSPSGRRKWQDRRERGDDRSLSPSPSKKPLGGEEAMSLDSEEEAEEEDEEMLQLRLQAIQAKLKLKKLQKAKGNGGGNSGARTLSRADSVATSPSKSRFREDVQVPLSPTKDRQPLKEHTSPARARLGLTTALKPQDVSLKRARDGTQLKRPRQNEDELARPKRISFGERLARSKADSQENQVKHERLERVRSKGFGTNVGSESTPRIAAPIGRETPRSGPEAGRPSSVRQPESFKKLESAANVARSSSTRSSQNDRPNLPRTNGVFKSHPQSEPGATHNDDSDSSQLNSNEENANVPSGYDPYSSLHLSKRHLSHPEVARAMEGKEIYTLPRLLKEVKAPHYDPPDCEADFVVFAILASKSSPFDQKATHRTSDEGKPQEDADKPRNKFMVLHLCDLKWELDCFLFGTAFDQFWKLTPGTLLAVLNPGIMPPKGNQHTGRFSLKLGSSEDCVMEIGLARDLGWCSSVKKDGKVCGSWVDKRSTEVCEFHVNMIVERERKHRMEVNSMWRSHEEGGRGRNKSYAKEAGDGKKKQQGNGAFHREYGQLYSVPSASAANLLDADDTDALHNMTKEEASRKRIATAQRERDLAKKLGQMGHGMGAEYLRTRNGITAPLDSDVDSESKALFDKPSAASLGLLGNVAGDQHLSPAKDRKKHFGLGAVSTSGTEAMGWGGAAKAGLLRPKIGSPERGQTTLRPGLVRERSQDGGSGSVSPSKKRARFALEKGIREPGRESLGVAGPGAGTGGGLSDDDLDIV